MKDNVDVMDRIRSFAYPGFYEGARAEGVYDFEFKNAKGQVEWRKKAHNTVMTLGKNLALDAYLAGSNYSAVGPFLGLISSVGYTPLSTTISSGTYTTGTGAVSLTTAAAHGLAVGDRFTLASMAGTGSYAALNGTFTAVTGTTGTTLNFVAATGLTITITGGNVTGTGIHVTDTMASHAAWVEAGSGSNYPLLTARLTMNGGWAAAASGAKALTAALAFTIGATGGTVEGAFVALGTGAVAALGSTAGVLYSAAIFDGGAQAVSAGGTLNVSYTASLN